MQMKRSIVQKIVKFFSSESLFEKMMEDSSRTALPASAERKAVSGIWAAYAAKLPVSR